MSFLQANGGNIVIKDKFGKEVSMHSIGKAYGDYKELYYFYLDHKDMVGKEELRERLEYIKKNGVKQRTEVETICWILGENLVGERE